jgi:N-acetylneuraminate synthase
MSTLEEVDAAVTLIRDLGNPLAILHCTSTYPAVSDELNLRCIPVLAVRYDVPIGYSGHEVGLATTLAAVATGACIVERHITLDRTAYGSDQASSVEPHGFRQLVRDIREIEKAMGDGVKRVYESEIPIRAKLRRALA